MAQRVVPPATYADLAALDEGVRGEIIFGQLETHPQPRPKHVASSSKLVAMLLRRFDDGDDGPGGWWIMAEPEVHGAGHVLVPDVAGWRVERMPELPDEPYFSLSPDWVCEFLSPSTAKRDRGVKMDAYASIGLGHLWLVDVDERQLEVFRREGTHWVRLAAFADDARFRAEPFDAVELDLGALWRAPTRR